VAAIERNLQDSSALDSRGHLVHPESRRKDHDAVAFRPAESAHQQVDGLVAASADQDPLGDDAIEPRQAQGQLARLRLGIAIEAAR
jgi:hypothetical protein